MKQAATHIRFFPFGKPRFSGIFGFLGAALAARAQRKALSELDDCALQDIGLSRREADIEASRPLWDVPANWRK